MILSMTGFGKGEYCKNDINVVTTLSSLNSRFFDCKIKLPKKIKNFEEKIYNEIKNFCKRGRISLNIELDVDSNFEEKIQLNDIKLVQYLDIIQQLENKHSLKNKISMEGILNLPDIISYNNIEINEIIEDILFNSLKIALEDLNKMRKIEGANLGSDLIKRIDLLNLFLKRIENELKLNSDKSLKKYKSKLNSIATNINFDENRILQEIVILLEKKDITEELTRLKSHYALFLDFLNIDGAVGKKLNFLHQEMIREVNTIGSKTDNIKISHIVINMKEEIEKIKEQVQNIL